MYIYTYNGYLYPPPPPNPVYHLFKITILEKYSFIFLYFKMKLKGVQDFFKTQ